MGSFIDPALPPMKPRRVLQACCGLAVAAGARGDDADDALAPPGEDDLLVFAFGARAGETSLPPTSCRVPGKCSPTPWPLSK